MYRGNCDTQKHLKQLLTKEQGVSNLDKIQMLSLPNDARVIVVSDIHGELDLFLELLEDVQFNEEDYLIINGDLCEKGRNSNGSPVRDGPSET